MKFIKSLSLLIILFGSSVYGQISVYPRVDHLIPDGVDTLGNITLTVSGSTSPYTYTWNPGSINTKDISNIRAGQYTLNVTSANSQTYSNKYSIGYKVDWTGLERCWFRNDSLVSSSNATNFLSKAVSKNTLTSGNDGWMELVLDAVPYRTGYVGFCDSLSPLINKFSDIDFGFYIYIGGGIGYCENGSNALFTGITPKAGDVLRLERVGNVINYKYNGVVKRSVTVSGISSSNYKLKAALSHTLRIINLGCSFLPSSSNINFPNYISNFPLIKHMTSSGTNDGSIKVTPNSAGNYTYSWNPTGSTSNSVTSLTNGVYKVDIKDSNNVTSSKYYNVGYKVGWTNTDLSYFRNDSLISSTGSTTIYNRAVSKNTLPASTDGWFEYALTETLPRNGYIGFIDSVAPNGSSNVYTDIDYGFWLDANNTSVYYYENGSYAQLQAWQRIGDILRIERIGNVIHYKINGVSVRTVTVSGVSSKIFKVKSVMVTGMNVINLGCSFDQSGQGYFANYLSAYPLVKHLTSSGTNDGSLKAIPNLSGSYTYTWAASGSTVNPISGISDGIYKVNIKDSVGNISSEYFNVGYKVNWTNMYQCTFRNDSLVSTTGLYYLYSKAISKNTLPANTDGWFEFVLNALPTKLGYIGFLDSTNTLANYYGDIDYGIYFYSDGARIGWYENGVTQWLTQSAKVGDIIRIERIGNTINYKINGSIRRTVTNSAINQKTFKLKAALTDGIKIVNLGCSFINGENTYFPGYVEVKPVIVRSSGTGISNGSITANKDFFGLKDYYWEPTNETTSTISNKLGSGSFKVTVSDSSNNTSSYIYSIGYKTMWKNFVNCILRNDTLKGTGGNAVSSYACTKNYLNANEDGWFEYVLPALPGGSNSHYIGFVDSSANSQSLTDIQYGFYYYAAGKTLNYLEGSVSASNIMTRTPAIGDVLRLERVGNTINYKLNGYVIRTVTNSSIGSKIFKLQAKLYQTNYLANIGCSFTPCTFTVNAGSNQTLISPSVPVTLFGSSNAPSGSTYSWTPGGSSSNTFSTSVLSAGIYTLLVTNTVSGCYNYDTVQVNTDYLKVIALKEHVTYDNPYSGIIGLSINGGKSPYSYTWQDASINSNIRTGLIPGVYNVTVRDSLNDSLQVAVHVGVKNNWRMVKDLSIENDLYTRTNPAQDSIGILVSHNYIPADTSGWSEITVTNKNQTLVFGYIGFNSTQLNYNYSVPYVTDENLFGMYPYVDSIVNKKFNGSNGTPSIYASKNFDAVHLVELSNGFVNIRFKGYSGTPITYEVGDVFRLKRTTSGVIKLYKNDTEIAQESFYATSQHLLNVMFIKSSSASFSSYGTLASTGNLNFSHTPSQVCNEPNLNWVISKTFDEYGAVKSESKVYMDMLGRTIQTQTKVLSSANVLVSEPMYDGFGRAVGQTLPAPSYNSSFCYVSNFVEVSNNTAYTHQYFDNPIGTPAPGQTAVNTLNAPGDVNHPLAVYPGNLGKLGWYYSNNNTTELNVAADAFPYSRVEYYNDPLARPKRTSGVGINHKMGSNHETKFIYTSTPPVNRPDLENELEYVFPHRTYELESDFSANTSSPTSINRNLQLFKSIAINSDGKDQITYSNSSGQTIATCITGDGSGCVTHTELKKIYAGNGEKTIETIYIPQLKAGTFKLYETDGTTKTYNHISPKLTDALTGNALANGTDFTYNSSNGLITFLGSYAGRSLYLSLGVDLVPFSYHMPVNNTIYASVEVDYTQWTLYFYDRKGRLLGNASPNDVVCQTIPYSVQKTIQTGKKIKASMMSPSNTSNAIPDSTNQLFKFDLNDNALRAGTNKLNAYFGFEFKVDSVFNFTVDSSAFSLFTLPSHNFSDSVNIFALPPVNYNDSLQYAYNDTLFSINESYDSLATYNFIQGDTIPESPLNLLLQSKIRYKGYFTAHAIFANDSIARLQMDSIPFDYKVEALDYDSITGAVSCRAFGQAGGNGGPGGGFVPMPELPPGTTGVTFVPHGAVTAVDAFPPEYGEDGTGGVKDPHVGDGLLSGAVLVNGGIFIDQYVPVPIPIHLSNKYMYDEFDRLIGSESDDEGRVDYVYDQKEDKLLFTQNDKQRANGNKFNCIIYDKLGRIKSTGEYNATTGNYVFQSYDQYYKHPVAVPSGKVSVGVAALANNTMVYDDGNVLEKTTIEYDNADANFPSAAVGNGYTQKYTAAKVSKTYNAKTTTWYSYDELGRMVVSVNNSSEMGNTVNFNSYDFRGKLVLSSYGSQNLNKTILHNFTYDADERLTSTKYAFSLTGLMSGGNISSSYKYYLHGPLKRMELGNKLQGLDYIYTIGGMLKSINNPFSSQTNLDPGMDGYATGTNANVSPDLFAYALQYYDNDYSRNGSPIQSYNYSSAFNGSNISYSGLIKNVTWRTTLPAGAGTNYNDALMYEYDYDDLYQLTNAQLGTISPASGNNATFTQLPEYKLDNLTYDKNGNMQSLRRYAAPNGSGGAHLLDNLTYNYNTTLKNRLLKVTDAVTNSGYAQEFDMPDQTVTGDNYIYNEIGELIENKQEHQGFEYNASGLTTRVYNTSNNNNMATFTYNDKGLRHSKTSYNTNGVAIKETYYSYDAGGALMATYIKDLITAGATTQLQDFTLYGAGRLGVYDEARQKAMYELTDHLGNVRAVVTKNSTSGLAETVSYTDYYPHGGVMPGRTYQNTLGLPYAYQGQEKDPETNLLNFELRQYDPRLGRWYNPDPMGQHHSPYLAMSNNPVSSIDPDGGRDVNGGINYDATYGGDDAMRDAQWASGGSNNNNDHWLENYMTSGSYHSTKQRMESVGNYLRKLKENGITLEETDLHPGEYGIWLKGSNHSMAMGSNGTARIIKFMGASLTWKELISKETVSRYHSYQGGLANYFFSGVAKGVGQAVGGTIMFFAKDAWKAETWRNFAATAYAVNNPLSFEGQMLQQNVVNQVKNADAHDYGNFTGQVLVAIAGTKGMSAMKGAGAVSEVASSGEFVSTMYGVSIPEDLAISRSAHRAFGNKSLYNALSSDAQFSKSMNKLLGYDVKAYMKSGKSGLKNPAGFEWHHQGTDLHLLERNVHRNPAFQNYLHPGANGQGGWGMYYGN